MSRRTIASSSSKREDAATHARTHGLGRCSETRGGGRLAHGWRTVGARLGRRVCVCVCGGWPRLRGEAEASGGGPSPSALASSVFPTPVGPRKRKEASGRLGSARPARERVIASATAFTAGACPLTRAPRLAGRPISFSASARSMSSEGMP
eukprot:6607991-Prymnesium_polylepis.1